jgi:nucleotide-binding universal stress UspA family protein
MSKHITVGFDGSPEAYEALRWGAAEAMKRGTELEIMECYHFPVASEIHAGWVPAEAYSGVERAAAAELGQARDVIASECPELTVTTSLRAGPAGTMLVEDQTGDQELIVVGASSHRGASAFWLGSTPRAVVRHANCPVVVVRGVSGRGGPNRVVVGVDGSEESKHAVRWAAAEADLHGVELRIVHAWEYPYVVVTTRESQARDLMQVDAACVLDDALALGREVCGSAVTGNLVAGGPASGLLGSVLDGDLLVLGSRGRGALRAGLFGSTVNSVLDGASVPVAVLRRDAIG